MFLQKLLINVRSVYRVSTRRWRDGTGFLKSPLFNGSRVMVTKHSMHQEPASAVTPVAAVGILAMLQTWFNKEEEDTLVVTIKRAILAKDDGAYDAAEQMLHVALKLAQERDDARAVAHIYDLLANVALESEQYEKAEDLFKEVLRHLISGGTEDSANSIIHISMKLAEIYSKTERDDLAELGYEFCLNHLKEKMSGFQKDSDPTDLPLLYALTLDSYAKFLYSRGRVHDAVAFSEKCLSLSQEYYGRDHVQTVTLTNDLASFYGEVARYDDAIKLLDEAVAEARRINHPDLAIFILNLGVMHANKKNFEYSVKFCKEAKYLAQINNNTDLIKRSQSCLNLKSGIV